jgi:hypothetical protein
VRFYERTEDSIAHIAGVESPAQARKWQKANPDSVLLSSVTTCLGIFKDPFLDFQYKPRRTVEIAREQEDATWQEVAQLVYGLRKHPRTGEVIKSSEFGTLAHAAMEAEVIRQHLSTVYAPPYDVAFQHFTVPWMAFLREEQITPLAVEHIVFDLNLGVAGSIDLVCRDRHGEIMLADYKFRQNTKGRGKFYPKDCWQLAIEADIIRRDRSLEYDPPILSICIDSETNEHHHKWWSKKERENGLAIAKNAVSSWRMINGL